MSFALLLPIFSTLIDRFFPNKEKADEAKLAMQKAMNEAQAAQAAADAAKVESQSKVIVAEATSQSYAARNWRPHLMYTLMLIVLYNWFLAGILRTFGADITLVPVPTELWTLLSVGLGGYIGKDAITAYSAAKFNNEKYFSVLKAKLFKQGMTQEQVDILNEAVNEARE